MPSAGVALIGSGSVWIGSGRREFDLIRSGATPQRAELRQNRPNPFNAGTVIPYHLQQPGYVTLRVFSLTGQLVRVLADELQPEGLNHVVWDACSEAPWQ